MSGSGFCMVHIMLCRCKLQVTSGANLSGLSSNSYILLCPCVSVSRANVELAMKINFTQSRASINFVL